MLYAKYVDPQCGFEEDKLRCRKYLILNELYEVDEIHMGQSKTDVFLKEVPGTFNSVNFDFYDEFGKAIDIYSDSRYNPYMTKVGDQP